MSEYFSTQAFAISKGFAYAAFKAHVLAMEGLGSVTFLNLNMLEDGVAAAVKFLSGTAELRDFEELKTIYPKGISLIKDSAEKLYFGSQEALHVTTRTGEALNEVAKDSFELASYLRPEW